MIMAIDPFIAAKGAEELGKVLNEGINEFGKTKRKEVEEEQETERHLISEKRKESEEMNETERHIVSEDNETKRHLKSIDKEIDQGKMDAINKSSDNVKDIAGNALDKTHGLLEKNTNKLAEVGSKTADYVKEIADTSAQKLQDAHDKHKREIEDKDKKHYGKMKEYQGLLQNASMEITKYRTIEEIRNQISHNVLSFADSISTYHQKIADTKNSINRAKIKLQPFQNDLQELEEKLVILDSHYEELHHGFDKQIYSLDMLKHEYKKSMKKSKYHEAYQRKKRELKHLLDEIEHKELELLNREHDRLNKVEEMEPMLQGLEHHEVALEYMENEYTKLISVGTHKISSLQTGIEYKNIKGESETIDAQFYEESKSNKLLT